MSYTDPRIEQLGLPELMLQLDHPERPLVLMSPDPDDGLVEAGPEDTPDQILRVEAWVEAGDQYIFTWRETPGWPPDNLWVPVLDAP